MPLLRAADHPDLVFADIDRGNAPPLAKGSPLPCSPGKTDKVSRRDLLRGFLGATLAAAVKGCITFSQNFNIHDFQPLDPEKRPVREESTLSPEQIGPIFSELMKTNLAIEIDWSNILVFDIQDGEILPVFKTDEIGIKAELQKQGFEVKGIYVYADQDPSFSEISLSIRKKPSSDNPDITIDIDHNGIKMVGYSLPTLDGKHETVSLQTVPYSSEADPTITTGLNTKKIRTPFPDGMKIFYSSEMAAGDGSKGVVDENGQFSFMAENQEPLVITDTASLIKFLKTCNSLPILALPLKGELVTPLPDFESTSYKPATLKIDFSTITIEDIVEIFRLLPKDLHYLAGFLTYALQYELVDDGYKDEYTDPVTTMRSGKGECDDYAVISAFWARLNGYTPSQIHINNCDDPDKIEDSSHVFVSFVNESGQTVVADDWIVTVLANGETMEDYVANVWEKHTITDNSVI